MEITKHGIIIPTRGGKIITSTEVRDEELQKMGVSGVILPNGLLLPLPDETVQQMKEDE